MTTFSTSEDRRVYVIGHRNPDTDSIVSAIAYASLRNALGDREYTATRLGPVSDETQMVLDRFGFEAPARLSDVRTQVRDLEFDCPPILSAAVTVRRAWEILQTGEGVSALPVTDEGGKLYGMLTAGDIAAYDMRSIDHPVLTEVPLFNLISTLEGRVVNEAENQIDTISGQVVIALPNAYGDPQFTPGCMAVCGQQPEMARRAIEAGASCVVLCQAEADEELRKLRTDTCVIATPYDPCRAARVVFQAIPASRICKSENLVCFHLDDYLDDVREKVLQNRYRCYPVLDENEKVVGTLSRFHLIAPRRKRVVLVDHNEAIQSVSGLEQAEILEIIDHHRLGTLQTGSPIWFRNEPVGSTATIIAGMYQEKGLMPSPKLAGMIAAAIVSDTVMFKSPTCTARDRNMAERMAHIAGVSLEELGHDIFAASSADGKTAEDLIFADYKDFHIAGHNLGIGQITCLNSEHLAQRKEEFLEVMRRTAEERGYDMMLLMLTDVLRTGTELIYLGDDEIIRQAFSVPARDNAAFLPAVVSRKKQVVPMLALLWG